MKPEAERMNVHGCAVYVLDSIVNSVHGADWHLACMRQFNRQDGKVSYLHDVCDPNQMILDWYATLQEEPDIQSDEFALFCEKVFACVHAFMCAPGFRL